jgi:hypothetical protein
VTFVKWNGSRQIDNRRSIANDWADDRDPDSVCFSDCYVNRPKKDGFYARYDGFRVFDCIFNQASGTYFYIAALSVSKFRVYRTGTVRSRPSSSYVAV